MIKLPDPPEPPLITSFYGSEEDTKEMENFITSDLLSRYEKVAGPIQFTLALLSPDLEGKVAQLMRQVISGKRPPITDQELGLNIPPEAET
jgi:hypothetical protein